MRTKVVAALFALCVVVAGAVIVFVGDDGDRRAARPDAGHRLGAAEARAPAGSHARFTYLAAQRSNQCGLQASAIGRYAKNGRLQGSCCSPMDEHAYRSQVRELRSYRHVRAVPRDPYDIPLALVRRLLRYDETISLNAPQRSIYRRAMNMSEQKGPCCCPCWRWNAFRGLTRHLLVRRRWPPARLAELVDALEGCGGPARDEHS
jgi:hypothetical protein